MGASKFVCYAVWYYTLQGRDAIDVDVTTFTQISEKEKKKLMANDTCFYCQKYGHCANDCRKKKFDHAQAEGSRGNQHSTNVKTADLIDFSTMTTEQTTNMITDYLQSKTFMEKKDDEKLKLIEKIAPQGF